MTSLYASTTSCLIKCASLRENTRDVSDLKHDVGINCARLLHLRLNANEEKSARPNLFEMKTYFRLIPWSNIPEQGRTNESIINVKNDLLTPIIRSEMHN